MTFFLPGKQARKGARCLNLVIALAILLTVSPSHAEKGADRASRSFAAANAAYEKADYPKAAELYRAALDEGIINARLYYNYANTLFRLQQLGLAILYYEKAHKLEPNDDDINYNLRFAAAQTVDKATVPEPNGLTKALWKAHSAFTINQGLWTVFLLFTSVFAAAFAALFTAAGTGIRGVFNAYIWLAVAAILTLAPSLAYKIRQQATVKHAIVIKDTVSMYSGPGDGYQVLTKVHEGAKFEITQTHGDWVAVKLSDGKGGFVRLADLGKV